MQSTKLSKPDIANSKQPELPNSADDTTISGMIRALVAKEVGPVVPGYIPGSVFSGVLNMMGCPTLIIDRTQHIHYANTAAEQALQAGGVLSRKDRQLVVEPPSAAFADALSATTRDGDPARMSLIIAGKDGRSTVAWFEPFDAALKSSDGLWSRGLVLLAFWQLQSKPRLSHNLLCEHFLLTPKEAELACHLAAGESLKDIVEIMRIQRSTARSHLAKCFSKTGVHRQPDLVALVLSLASPMHE